MQFKNEERRAAVRAERDVVVRELCYPLAPRSRLRARPGLGKQGASSRELAGAGVEADVTDLMEAVR